MLQHDGLKFRHDLRRLHRVRTRTDTKINVRLRHPKIVKKRIRHRRIVMLPRMNDHRRKLLRTPPHLGIDRRDLHKIGPCTRDV